MPRTHRLRKKAHDVSTFLAAHDKDWLLGPFAGDPNSLHEAYHYTSLAGALAYASATIASRVFDLDLGSTSKIALTVGAAALTGVVAWCIRSHRARREPDRGETRRAELRSELDRMLSLDSRTRRDEGEFTDFLVDLAGGLPGESAGRTWTGDWVVREEGDDTSFRHMTHAMFQAYAHTLARKGRRLTTFEIEANGDVVMNSYQGGVLQDLHPGVPAVARITHGHVQVQSWSMGKLAGEGMEDMPHRRQAPPAGSMDGCDEDELEASAPAMRR